MSKRKSGIGLLGLLAVVALGVMAFASSAQALTPKYLVGKKAVVGELNATLEGKLTSTVSTLSVAALNTEFNCTKFTVGEGVLKTATDAKGRLTYEECTVLELKSPLGELPCTVKNSKKIIATGLVLPAELKNGEPAVLVEEIEALIGMLEGTECPLPLDNIVKGDLCLKIEGNDTPNPVVAASQTIQGECRARETLGGAEIVGKTQAEIEALEKASPQKAFLDEVKYGSQISFVTGKAEVFATGAHNGLALGVSLQ